MKSTVFPSSTAILLSALVLSGCGPGSEDEVEKGNFDPDHLVQVDIQMAESDWESLRNQYRDFTTELVGDCMSQPFSAGYTYFPADVVIDGESASNVGVRKKGFIGSQSREKPGLKINVDEWEEGQELFGVDNITLNNAVQDPSLIKQCLGYQLFAEAGLPASQCNFAQVSVNGEDLGIYVHVEPVKPAFLRTHFGNDHGDLYEGTLSDFHPLKTQTFQSKTDATDASLAPILALSEALEARDEPLLEILEAHIDLDQYLSFWAMETLIGHWDGYNGANTNNFFVYRNPDIERFQFIPWGIDGILYPEAFESGFEEEELSLVPTGSVLASSILRSNQLHERYYTRLYELLDAHWDEDFLISEVDRMEALVAQAIDVSDIEGEIDRIRDYIWGIRDALEGLTHTRPEKASNPWCLQEIGSLEGSFETRVNTFGFNAFHEISALGEADMQAVWDGYSVPFQETGAASYVEENGWLTVVLSGLIDDEGSESYVMPYFSFDREGISNGSSIPIDQTQMAAGLLYTERAMGFELIQAAWILGGSLEIEQFEPVTGGTLSGSFSTSLYDFQEISSLGD
ncbi:MAG: CotH kinase family protein [Myxococcota bacterium]|nr:CotH kinase family protein [Myxococcota bacterium]